MRHANGFVVAMSGVLITLFASGSDPGAGVASPSAQQSPSDDPVKVLISRLDQEKYKATVKGLTQFGDRREGTDRNRAANDWIEAALRRYSCTNIERLHYAYDPSQEPARRPRVESVI